MIEKHSLLKSYEFNAEESLRADLLPEETFCKLQTKLTTYTLESLDITFQGTAEERQNQMLVHANMNGKIEFIRELLEEAVQAHNRLSQT